MEAHTEVQGHPLRVPAVAGPAPLPFGTGASSEELTAETRRRDRIYRRLLGLARIVAALLAAPLAIPQRGPDGLHAAALLVAPGMLVAAKALGLYDRDELLIRKTT